MERNMPGSKGKLASELGFIASTFVAVFTRAEAGDRLGAFR
jgi:hypothetical protein